jgi:hypothetical protein
MAASPSESIANSDPMLSQREPHKSVSAWLFR